MKTQNVGKSATVKKRKISIICNLGIRRVFGQSSYLVAFGKSSVDLCFAYHMVTGLRKILGRSSFYLIHVTELPITCTLCKKLYICETGRRLGDRFREHLCDVEKGDKNASKPVARHFNLPNHSKQHMVVCGLSLHQGSTESRKTLEQKFIFQIGTLNPHGINERFSFN